MKKSPPPNSPVVDANGYVRTEWLRWLMESAEEPIDAWEDLRVPVNAVKVGPTKVPTLTAYKGSHVYAFADQALAANEEQITFAVQLPHSYLEGSAIYPHVHWVGQDNTAGNVRWELSYSWANIGSAFPGAQSIYITDANLDTDVHNIASFLPITGTGKTISSMLLCALSRNSSNALDTFNGKSAYLLEVDFHFQVDSHGSREELTK